MTDHKVTCSECGAKYFLDRSGEIVGHGDCIVDDCPLELDRLEEIGYFPLNFDEKNIIDREYDVDFHAYLESLVEEDDEEKSEEP